MGPLIFDINGYSLGKDDIDRLKHPCCGGVIIFKKNYKNLKQFRDLCSQIKKIKTPELIITIDQEGGRVQRLKSHFTTIPPMRKLGRIWDKNKKLANDLSYSIGFVISYELSLSQVDLSFIPVLDIDHGASKVIGDRSFHRDSHAIVELCSFLRSGLRNFGFPSVGKHFPGHGFVEPDSHYELPHDNRDFKDIEKNDLIPYKKLIKNGLEAIMPAHIVYSKVDNYPAGFSKFWLKDVLRKKLCFDGVIISDDLSMGGAAKFGTIIDRAKLALNAGCDIILVCNNVKSVDIIIDNYTKLPEVINLAQKYNILRSIKYNYSIKDKKKIIEEYKFHKMRINEKLTDLK